MNKLYQWLDKQKEPYRFFWCMSVLVPLIFWANNAKETAPIFLVCLLFVIISRVVYLHNKEGK